jgi:hypothetical protein
LTGCWGRRRRSVGTPMAPSLQQAGRPARGPTTVSSSVRLPRVVPRPRTRLPSPSMVAVRGVRQSLWHPVLVRHRPHLPHRCTPLPCSASTACTPGPTLKPIRSALPPVHPRASAPSMVSSGPNRRALARRGPVSAIMQTRTTTWRHPTRALVPHGDISYSSIESCRTFHLPTTHC